ncbi:MAG: sialidase family protein [Desulfovibrionaceae bacterium]
MPVLYDRPERQVVIDRRPEHYLCFPDVCLTTQGDLLCVYQEYDQHAATRRRLLLRRSTDLGATWTDPEVYNEGITHCPRLRKLKNGHIWLLDQNGRTLLVSTDHGRTWDRRDFTKVYEQVVFDRPLELADGLVLTTGHSHRGSVPQPWLRQPRTEQLVYHAVNQGRNIRALSVLAADPWLALCEASMASLPDGRILALMRENSMVYEPMYFCLSADQGRTWTDPAPTCLVGHRPTLDLTSSGKLLVTYRETGPCMGTSAWLGTLEELARPYEVRGLTPLPDSGEAQPEIIGGSLRIATRSGRSSAVRYSLRPLSDPVHSRAELTAVVRVLRAESEGCGIRFGGAWWRLFPDRLVMEVAALDDAGKECVRRRWCKLPEGRFNEVRLSYVPGQVTLRVNGRKRAVLEVDHTAGLTRPIVFGTANPLERNGGEHLWQRLSLRTSEPRLGREYAWDWDAGQGLPDAWKRAHVLELADDRHAAYGDFGYSGWIELPDKRFFCAFHHGGGDEPGYVPGRSAHVRGVWFTEEDFGPGS